MLVLARDHRTGSLPAFLPEIRARNGQKKKKWGKKRGECGMRGRQSLISPPRKQENASQRGVYVAFCASLFWFSFFSLLSFFFSFSLVFILVLSGTGALAQTLECIQSQIKNEFCSHAKKVCLLSACRRKFKECWNNWNISVGFRWCFPFIRNCLGSLGEVVLRNQNCLEGDLELVFNNLLKFIKSKRC